MKGFLYCMSRRLVNFHIARRYIKTSKTSLGYRSRAQPGAYNLVREAAKSNFFSGPATKREGGGKGLATEKKDFFSSSKKNPTKICGH